MVALRQKLLAFDWDNGKKKKPVQTKRKMENESFSRRYKGVYKGKSEGNHDTR